MIENWKIIFGSDSININIFEKNSFLNHDLLDDFTEKIDIQLIGKLNKEIPKLNQSISLYGQTLLHIFSEYLSENNDYDKELKENLLTFVSRNYQGKGKQLSSSMRKKINDMFFKSNDAVRREFFPDRKVLFQLSDQERTTNKIVHDESMKIIVYILKILKESKKHVDLNDQKASLFRDSALKLEKDNPEMALELMEIAHKIRPDGPFIKKKLKEYKNII